MANQEVPVDIVVEDANVWKAFAGAASHHLPTVGSPVYYLPNLHRAATDGFAADQPPLAPAQIAAVVTDMELRAYGEDLYVRYRLVRPADAVEGAEEELAGLDDAVSSFNKKVSDSDMSSLNAFYLPKAMAETLLPAAPKRLNSRTTINDQAIQFVDIQNNPVDLTRRYHYNTKRNQLVDSWDGYRKGKRLKADDYIVCTERPTGLYFGPRRSQSCKKVSSEQFNSAFHAAQQVNQEFTVDYFPGRASQNEYVVLKSFVDRSVNWKDGKVVRMRSNEDDKGRAVFTDGVIRDPIKGDHSSRLYTVETEKQTFTEIRPWNLIPEVLNLFHDADA